MSPTSHFRILRPSVWALALIALLAVGCGEKSAEELLAEATEELTSSAQAKDAAKTSLDQLDERLAKAQGARDTAFEAFEEARIRWESAKDAVGEFATDEVLHHQINRMLLDSTELGDSTIQARVEDHVVTLIGTASDQEAIDHAVELTGAVPGVYRVSSQVVIPVAEATDASESETAAEEPEAEVPTEAKPETDVSEAAPELLPADEPAVEALESAEETEEFDATVPGPGDEWNPEADPLSEEPEAPLERQI